MLLALLIVIVGIVAISMGVLYEVSHGKIFKHIFHDILGWHIVDQPSDYDGCSLHGICIICGTECKQDSQGNWY